MISPNIWTPEECCCSTREENGKKRKEKRKEKKKKKRDLAQVKKGRELPSPSSSLDGDLFLLMV